MKNNLLATIKALDTEQRNYSCLEDLGDNMYLLEDLDIKNDPTTSRPPIYDSVLNINNVPLLSNYHVIVYCQDILESSDKGIGMYQGRIIGKKIKHKGNEVKIPLLMIETVCVAIS